MQNAANATDKLKENINNNRQAEKCTHPWSACKLPLEVAGSGGFAAEGAGAFLSLRTTVADTTANVAENSAGMVRSAEVCVCLRAFTQTAVMCSGKLKCVLAHFEPDSDDGPRNAPLTCVNIF